MNSKRIAVDFDGVIHQYSKGWHDGTIYDVPVEGAKEKISLLIKCGFDVVIFTNRTEKEAISEWLKKYDFSILEITNQKPTAFAYIDDRAIRFTNWEDIVKYFI